MTKKKLSIPDGYVTDVIVTSWDKKIKDFKIVLLRKKNTNMYNLPGRFVDVTKNETALDTAKIILNKKLGHDYTLFRHIAVFDDPKKDPRGHVVSNVMLAIVDEVDDIVKTSTYNKFNVVIVRLGHLKKIEKIEKKFPQYEAVMKFQKIIDYDIYCQIFDTKKFGSKFIRSLLGERFTTSQLIALAKWAGRTENKTTFYRNIDNNYQFDVKVGRNRYYIKKK